MKNWVSCGLLFLSVFLFYLGCPIFRHPPILSYLLLIFLVPLFLVLENQAKLRSPIKQSIFSCFMLWIFGFIFQFVFFFWVFQSIPHFAHFSKEKSFFVFVVYCLFSSIFFIVLFSPLILQTYFTAKCKNKPIPVVVLCFCFTFFEIVTPRFFHWSFGSGMGRELYVNQLTSLFGTNTISFFLFFTNLSLSRIIYSKNILFIRKTIFINLCFWIIIILFGKLRVDSIDKNLAKASTSRIAFIQPNFTFNSMELYPLPSKDISYRNLENLLTLSRKAIEKSFAKDAKKPDLLVWPESVTPDFFIENQFETQKVLNLSKEFNLPFLIQTYKFNKLLNENNRTTYWSTAFIFSPTGIQKESYNKWSLMPFTETIPLQEYFPKLAAKIRAIVTNTGNLISGNSFQALPFGKNLHVAPLICFDSLNARLAYLQASKGNASVFVSQANYVWMTNSNVGYKGEIMNQARAVENARSLVMVSNSGPSTAYDPLGRVLFPETSLLSKTYGFVDVPIYTGNSIFSLVYKWPLIFAGIFSFVFIFFWVRKNHPF